MNEAPSLSPAAPTADAQQEPKTFRMSRASAKHNRVTGESELAEIIEQMRSGSGGVRATVERIRGKYWQVMEETKGDRQAAKESVHDLKLALPAVMWSGTFASRKKDALSQHSALICADLDHLGREKLSKVITALRGSIHLLALFISPTGDGLKAVFLVSADAEKHAASFKAVEQHVLQLTGVQIDSKCSDVARLCFLSYDPELYLNREAIELPPLSETNPRKSTESSVLNEGVLQIRRIIASELLGDIAWNSLSSGHGACPGQDLHTSGDGDRDCQVYLDRVPTITCFHDSCSDIVQQKNYELRSRIGKQERLLSEASPEIQLPEIVSADHFLAQPLEIPPELVGGMIHQGTLTMFAGGSKACKSFIVLDLAISVSQGLPWWGRKVEKGRVLYVNFELAPAFLQQRLSLVAEAKGLADDDVRPFRLPGLDLWNLRGYAANVNQLMPMIVDRCRGKAYSMIILDPMYKLLGGRNENAAGEMCEVLNHFDKLAHETGAAVIYSHHFAKGSAAMKEQLDRASGSGVFARHADAIITITPHEQEGAAVVEATLRNLPAPAPFVMRWSYPLMRVAPELSPKKLRGKPGAKPTFSLTTVLDNLQDGMTTGQWREATYLMTGMVDSTFFKFKRLAVEEGLIEERSKKWFRTLEQTDVNRPASPARDIVALRAA